MRLRVAQIRTQFVQELYIRLEKCRFRDVKQGLRPCTPPGGLRPPGPPAREVFIASETSVWSRKQSGQLGGLATARLTARGREPPARSHGPTYKRESRLTELIASTVWGPAGCASMFYSSEQKKRVCSSRRAPPNPSGTSPGHEPFGPGRRIAPSTTPVGRGRLRGERLESPHPLPELWVVCREYFATRTPATHEPARRLFLK